MQVSALTFMNGVCFLLGMIFVWGFGIAHDLIVNWYRKAIYAREMKKEKKLLHDREQQNQSKTE